MNEVLFKYLQAFGLSDKETRAYTTVLRLGLATANEIAKEAKINRSSAYVVLEALTKKGLIGVSDDKKVRKYVAASPDVLLHSARSSADKQEKIVKGIESSLPELRALYKNAAHKPLIKVYEGVAGIMAGFEDSLECKEKLLRVISSIEKVNALLPPEYFPNYLKQRMEKGVKMHGIHPANKILRQYMKLGIPKLDEMIIIPEEEFKAPADLAIYDNKIGYISAEDGGYSITIESKELAEVMKNIFDLAWIEAKKRNKQPAKKRRAS